MAAYGGAPPNHLTHGTPLRRTCRYKKCGPRKTGYVVIESFSLPSFFVLSVLLSSSHFHNFPSSV